MVTDTALVPTLPLGAVDSGTGGSLALVVAVGKNQQLRLPLLLAGPMTHLQITEVQSLIQSLSQQEMIEMLLVLANEFPGILRLGWHPCSARGRRLAKTLPAPSASTEAR